LGNLKPEFLIAERTLSLASRVACDANPTSSMVGIKSVINV